MKVKEIGMKAAKDQEVATGEVAVKTPRVRKGSVSVNAAGSATVKIAGGGGVEVQLNPELIDDFAVFGFQAFFKGLIAQAESVEELEESLKDAVAKMEAGEFPVTEKVRKTKPDHLVEAIAEVNGVTVEKAAAWLEKQDRKGKLAARRDGRVAAVLARLEGREEASKSTFEGLADSL